MEGSEIHTALHYLHYKACTFAAERFAVPKSAVDARCEYIQLQEYCAIQQLKKDPTCGSFKSYLWRR
jgi:hypothetical protein